MGVVKTTGAVAAGDARTAEAGAFALREGGTAVDAVLAAAFTAFVVEPPLCSPGGAGVLLAGTPAKGLRILDFFAAAPGSGIEEDTALDFVDVTVDFGPATQVFHVGRGSAAVPGMLPGLLEAHRELCELPLEVLVAPAVGHAREGFVPSPGIRWVIDLLEPIVTLTPGSAAMYEAQGGLPSPAKPLHNRPLADFLEGLAAEGDAMVRGPVWQALLATCGPEVGGRMTLRDLEQYRPRWREPIWCEAFGHRIATNPPPSSGGTLIALALSLAERAPTPAWLGPAHAEETAALLRAVSDFRGGGYDDAVADPHRAAALLQGESRTRAFAAHDARREERSLGSTTHISVLDGRGDVASLTMSNGEGSGHVLDGLGIQVNNFLGEEDINPHGFHSLPAGRRMTTMMAPSAACRGAEPVMVVGSGGSNRIRSAIVQVALGRLQHRRRLRDCVEAPRVHVEGEQLWYEAAGWGEEALAALEASPGDVTRFSAPNMFFGGAHAVVSEGGRLEAAGDPRRGGATATVG